MDKPKPVGRFSTPKVMGRLSGLHIPEDYDNLKIDDTADPDWLQVQS